MNLNTGTLNISGALVSWRGVKFRHRGRLSLPLDFETFDLDVEPFGIINKRPDVAKLMCDFTPSGRFTEADALVNRYATARKGEYINIEQFPISFDTTTNVGTTTGNHLLTTGDEVMVHSLITMAAPLSRTTRYYARVASATTITLYDTYAHAIDTGNTTGLLDITTTGTGMILDVTRPLYIWLDTGLQIKYYNAALVKVPQLRFTAKDSILGECGFQMFVRNGQDPEDPTNRFYDISVASGSDTSFEPADIKSLSPVISWDNGSPWSDGLSTKSGVTVDFDLKTESLPNDAFGEDAIGRIFSDLGITVKAEVQGVTEAEAKAALQLHSAVRGDVPSAQELSVTTTAHSLVVGSATLKSAPMGASTTEERNNEFAWIGHQTYTAGDKNPLFVFEELP